MRPVALVGQVQGPTTQDPAARPVKSPEWSRIFGVACVFLVGITVGQLFLSLAPMLTGGPEQRSLVGILGAAATVNNALLLSACGACGYGYLLTSGNSVALTVNLRLVERTLLYLLSMGIMVPVVPTRVLLPVLFMALVLATYREGSLPGRRFWVVFAVFVGFTVAGMLRGVVGMDPVRGSVAIPEQLALLVPYLVALIVLYGVESSHWGRAELEIPIRVSTWAAALLGVEALLTFVPGRTQLFPGLDPSIHVDGALMGALPQDVHVVARVAIIGIFGALYFAHRSGRRAYGLLVAAAGLALVATLIRAALLAAVVGLGIYVLLARSRTRSRRSLAVSYVIGVMSLAGCLLAANTVLTRVTEVRGAAVLQTSVANRLLHWSRGVDVLLYSPVLGSGPELDQIYMGSSQVPMVVLSGSAVRLGVSQEFAIGRVVRTDLFSEADERSYTIHSVWMEFLVHWGVAGAAGILYLITGGVRATVRIYKKGGQGAPGAIIALAFSLSVSVFMTSHFGSYWLFVAVFGLVGFVAGTHRVAEAIT